tara:strand:+ start:871 stop:1758 length:888 start_codon:yes stop_codon:yes gene_type:complete
MNFFRFLIIFLLSFNAYAGDEEIVKKNVINKFTSSLSSAVENILDGEGDTQVQIKAGEELKPEFSIVTVRPISHHPGVDSVFVQLQLNDTKIRGSNRLSINSGIGYRKLSDNKNSLTGGNIFLDYDEEGNARASIGLELRSSAFELLANYYAGISSGQKVGDYTERTLDGIEVSAIGQVPYIPWANVIAKSYEWEAEKNSKNSKGEKFSLELTLTPNIIAELGYDDNNISGTSNFAKIMFVYPARETPTASTDFISDTAFVKGDMSLELLSIVRRTNKQIIESDGTGIKIARTSE